MTSGVTLLAEEAGRYVHWGVIQISVSNLTMIAAMIALFILALIVPFPGHGEAPTMKADLDDDHR